MADIIEAREKIKVRVELALDSRTAEETRKVIGEVCDIAEKAGEEREGAFEKTWPPDPIEWSSAR